MNASMNRGSDPSFELGHCFPHPVSTFTAQIQLNHKIQDTRTTSIMEIKSPLERIRTSENRSIQTLLPSRQDARIQHLFSFFWSQIFSLLELVLVLLALGFGIATTVYAARGEVQLWAGIGSTAVGTLLALVRGMFYASIYPILDRY
jgi:hypothetical protein